MSKEPLELQATEEEVRAWEQSTGHETTLEWYMEDLNSGSSGLHPSIVRAFHDAWVARDAEVAALKERVTHFKALAHGVTH